MPAPSPDTVAAVLRQVDSGLDRSRETLFDLLRIPSISAQPAHQPDCLRAAEWVRGQLAGLGFQADIRPTPGHPVVVAHHPGPSGYTGPHILFYGHYDVQPVDPLDLWTSPPFEPQLVDGPRGQRFVARGAVDDKGQVMMFIEALRAWATAGGGIPARITVLIEGEEEVGSANLEPFLRANKDALASDLALISDTGMWDVDTPAVTTRLRGMTYVEVTLKAANRDLHSGLFGGSALNPINALTKILGELQDTDGRIQ
jgi:acetylornithine deacetylase/succinyl-diaminopimelate desuccinylase-like protein